MLIESWTFQKTVELLPLHRIILLPLLCSSLCVFFFFKFHKFKWVCNQCSLFPTIQENKWRRSEISKMSSKITLRCYYGCVILIFLDQCYTWYSFSSSLVFLTYSVNVTTLNHCQICICQKWEQHTISTFHDNGVQYQSSQWWYRQWLAKSHGRFEVKRRWRKGKADEKGRSGGNDCIKGSKRIKHRTKELERGSEIKEKMNNMSSFWGIFNLTFRDGLIKTHQYQ